MPRRRRTPPPPKPPKLRPPPPPTTTAWIEPGHAHFRMLDPADRAWTANQLDSEPNSMERLFISRQPKPRYRDLLQAVEFQLGRPAPLGRVRMRRGVPLEALGAELLEALGGPELPAADWLEQLLMGTLETTNETTHP